MIKLCLFIYFLQEGLTIQRVLERPNDLHCLHFETNLEGAGGDLADVVVVELEVDHPLQLIKRPVVHNPDDQSN